MQFYDVLKECGKNSGVSMRGVGLELGHSSGYVANMRNSGTPTVDTAHKLLGVCGYGLYALPIADAPKDALRITPNDQDATNG